ncbi:proline dehydrogenase family protein [Propionicicella superfundia]|uniref:proline dehydrogenase family protein n=1 Tax=Propionicicella superfundia TaxID=348582 RepID=UPI0003FED64D|nr:proline dehydrogenase family protein [Propionicicella superfundia]
MLRRTVAAVVGSKPLAAVGQAFPPARALAAQFVAGDTLGEALPVVKSLVADGFLVTMDVLGEAVETAAAAEKNSTEYLDLLQWLAAERLTDAVEVSLKLSAVGQALPDGDGLSGEHARLICAAAHGIGSAVTLDMEDHTTTDLTLGTWRSLLPDYPRTAAVLQARLFRTPDDLNELAVDGRRIRLCKGAYTEPAEIAHRRSRDVDKAYVRGLKQLFAADAYPMIATHDSRLIEIAQELAARAGREPGSYEFQFLYGVAAKDQERLRDAGERVRLYLPYGTEWYRYFSRRLIERPANLGLMLRALGRRRP